MYFDSILTDNYDKKNKQCFTPPLLAFIAYDMILGLYSCLC